MPKTFFVRQGGEAGLIQGEPYQQGNSSHIYYTSQSIHHNRYITIDPSQSIHHKKRKKKRKKGP